MITLPFELMTNPQVQAAILYLLLFGGLWLGHRSLKHGEALAKLTVLVTNHYAHRFEKLRKQLGLEWDEDEE